MATVDFGPPRALSKPPRPPACERARKEKAIEAALADINMISNIAKEMSRPPGMSVLDRRGPQSLNYDRRKKELQRIDKENAKLLKRLEGAKPTYKKKDQGKAYTESRRHVALAMVAKRDEPIPIPRRIISATPQRSPHASDEPLSGDGDAAPSSRNCSPRQFLPKVGASKAPQRLNAQEPSRGKPDSVKLPDLPGPQGKQNAQRNKSQNSSPRIGSSRATSVDGHHGGVVVVEDVLSPAVRHHKAHEKNSRDARSSPPPDELKGGRSKNTESTTSPTQSDRSRSKDASISPSLRPQPVVPAVVLESVIASLPQKKGSPKTKSSLGSSSVASPQSKSPEAQDKDTPAMQAATKSTDNVAEVVEHAEEHVAEETPDFGETSKTYGDESFDEQSYTEQPQNSGVDLAGTLHSQESAAKESRDEAESPRLEERAAADPQIEKVKALEQPEDSSSRAVQDSTAPTTTHAGAQRDVAEKASENQKVADDLDKSAEDAYDDDDFDADVDEFEEDEDDQEADEEKDNSGAKGTSHSHALDDIKQDQEDASEPSASSSKRTSKQKSNQEDADCSFTKEEENKVDVDASLSQSRRDRSRSQSSSRSRSRSRSCNSSKSRSRRSRSRASRSRSRSRSQSRTSSRSRSRSRSPSPARSAASGGSSPDLKKERSENRSVHDSDSEDDR